ncbi:MAG TPA: FG-GAP-like repeat-containing protein [Clostridia bacterium]|nr:FG-GAP-like repeat-containing protein [Clostridia bacterium]
MTSTRLKYAACVPLLLLLPALAAAQTFTSANVSTGASPSKLVRADFNNDGTADLLTANGSGSVTVLLSRGDGTFRRLDYTVGSQLVDVITTDFNRDGKVDLALRDDLGTEASPNIVVKVALGNGDGSFQAARQVDAGTNAVSIAAADFNGDGRTDLASVWVTRVSTGPYTQTSTNHLRFLFGDGAGSFPTRRTYDNVGRQSEEGESSYIATQIVAADLNFDGRSDIAMIECCGGFDVEIGDVYMMRNDGSGNFTGVDLGTVSVPQYLTASDMDQNGPADLLISYSGCHTPCHGLTIWNNPATPSFTRSRVPEPAAPAADTYFYSSVAADFDNDGRKDVAYSAQQDRYDTGDWRGIAVSRRLPDGTFANPVTLSPTNGGFDSLVTGDFNRDGRMDIAGLNAQGWVTVYRNTTSTAQVCSQPTGDPSLNVCAPAGGSTVASPVRFLATPTSSTPVSGMKVYVDSVSRFTTADDRISALLNLSAGTHRVVVKGWNLAGPFSKSLSITVGSTGGSCTASTDRSVVICSPANGATISSPVRVLAALRSNSGIKAAQLYIDGTLNWQGGAGTTAVDRSVSLPAGTHRITVKGWDGAGSFSSSISITVSSTASCSATANRTVTICAPAGGATVGSPVRVLAGLRSDTGVTAAQIYRDGTLVWQGPSGTTTVDQSLSMSAGSHRITVKGWDRAGPFSSSSSFTVR